MKKEVKYRTVKSTQVKKTTLQIQNKMNTEKKKKREEKKKYEKHSLNLHLFTKVISVITNQIPWGVDGTSIYLIKCDEEVWHDKQKDGRCWRMVKSSKVSLNGPRKFGVCNRSYICENPECAKVTTEGVQNLIEFKQEKGGATLVNAVDAMPTRGTVDASR